MNDMDDFVRGWFSSEIEDDDQIKVKRIYIDMCDGDIHAALILSQILYWNKPSKKTGETKLSIEHDGFLWLAKAYEDWWEECRVKAVTAKRAILKLQKSGLIICALKKFNGAPTKHIRVNWDVFSRMVQCFTRSSDLRILPKGLDQNDQNGLDQFDQIHQINLTKSLTETTAQTTSKNKNNTPAGDVVPAKAKKKKQSTTHPQYQETVDLIVNAFGWKSEHMGKSHFGLVGKVAKSLLEIPAFKPEDVQALYTFSKSRYPKVSPMGLVSFFPEWKQTQPAPKNFEDLSYAERDRIMAEQLKDAPRWTPTRAEAEALGLSLEEMTKDSGFDYVAAARELEEQELKRAS